MKGNWESNHVSGGGGRKFPGAGNAGELSCWETQVCSDLEPLHKEESNH